MKKILPTSAEIRGRYQPVRTWAALSVIGILISVVRNVLYDIPLIPVRVGLAPFLVLSAVGAVYATVIIVWLSLRRRYVC
jgi:hypothetical protein